MTEEKRRPGHVYSPDQPLPDHLRPKPEAELPARRLRDVDSAERSFKLKAFTWSLTGLLIGVGLGVNVAMRTDMELIPAMLLFGLGMWALMYFGGLFLAERSGRVGASIYFRSGASTRGARQYSLADSLIARGRFLDAAEELERAAGVYPEDSTPKIRLARLYRDELQRPEDAITWFRAVLDMPNTQPPLEQSVTRELIEVYTHRLHKPRAAAPLLARLAQKYPDTPAGQWAARELADLKREMREE